MAAFTQGEAVLVPVRVIRQPDAANHVYGRASITAGWSEYRFDFTEGSILNGLARGVIAGASHTGSDQWDVLIENGLAGGTVTVPGDMLASALEPMREAA